MMGKLNKSVALFGLILYETELILGITPLDVCENSTAEVFILPHFISISSSATIWRQPSEEPWQKKPLQDWRRLHAVILAERKFQSILPTLSCNLIAALFELQDCERIFGFCCHDGCLNKSSCCDPISQRYIRNFRPVTTLSSRAWLTSN